MALPGLAPQNLRIYTLENGLIVKSNLREARSAPDKLCADGSQGIFYWWPFPAGANVPGVIAEFKHNHLEIKIPIIRKAQAIEKAPGKESAEAQKTAAA
jgi:hypothetical protein